MYQHLPSPVKFREDINGLRAWAVLAVLLFHFSLIGLPGGFAGVDVFFVISGYLMTAIIIGGYEKGHFSIWKFYMARARRILPALIVLILVLLVFGWFWLPTTYYQELGIQSAYSMSFLSNIFYWRSADYFDTAAEEKWLLHTWSLAVEAQFYLLYPIFIALVWRIWKSFKAIIIGLILLFSLSFLFNLVLSIVRPSAAFYLLPTRGWELAAGGLVYFIAKYRVLPSTLKRYSYWLGWILVLSSFILINQYLAWPSYLALLPVIGTSLIILAEQENCKLTNNALAQWLGDRSYSLYLWHWPLIVALYFANLENEWHWVIPAFALSILLAHLSYQFVETPTRQYLSRTKLLQEVVMVTSVGMVIIVSSLSIRFFEFDARSVSPEVDQILAELNNKPERTCFVDMHGQGEKGCAFGGTDTQVYLIGDSHAHALRSALTNAVINVDPNYGLKFWGLSGCPTIKDAIHTPVTKRNPFICKKFNDDFLDFIKQETNPTPVILVSRASLAIYGYNGHDEVPRFKPYMTFEQVKKHNIEHLFKQKIIETGCEIAQNRTTYFVRPIPEMIVNPSRIMALNRVLGREIAEIKIPLEDYHKRNKLVWEAQDAAAKQCGVKILDPLPYLCDDTYCYGSKNGRPLYYDDDHLSEHGNKLLVPMFEEIFIQ